jgi:hypothetical protein
VKQKFRLLAAGALASLGTFGLGWDRADASLSVCRVDPVVTLSDGTQVTLYTDTQDSVSDIRSVTYELHIPKYLTVVSVQYDQYGYLEHLTVYSDSQLGVYRSIATVYTGKTVTATAFASIGGPKCATAQSATQTNTTPHPLPNNFNC